MSRCLEIWSLHVETRENPTPSALKALWYHYAALKWPGTGCEDWWTIVARTLPVSKVTSRQHCRPETILSPKTTPPAFNTTAHSLNMSRRQHNRRRFTIVGRGEALNEKSPLPLTGSEVAILPVKILLTVGRCCVTHALENLRKLVGLTHAERTACGRLKRYFYLSFLFHLYMFFLLYIQTKQKRILKFWVKIYFSLNFFAPVNIYFCKYYYVASSYTNISVAYYYL